MDKKVCVFDFLKNKKNAPIVRKLYLSVRCKGMEIEGLKGDSQRRRLKELIKKYDCTPT